MFSASVGRAICILNFIFFLEGNGIRPNMPTDTMCVFAMAEVVFLLVVPIDGFRPKASSPPSSAVCNSVDYNDMPYAIAG